MTIIRKQVAETVAAKLARHRYMPELDALRVEWAALAYQAWLRAHPDEPKMSALPEGWLREDTSIWVSFGGAQVVIHFNGSEADRQLSQHLNQVFPHYVKRRILAHYNDEDGSKCFPVFEGTDVLTNTWRDLNDRTGDLVARVKSSIARTKGTLLQLRTYEKVVKEWPQVIPFFPTTEGLSVALVPMIPINDLNAEMGL